MMNRESNAVVTLDVIIEELQGISPRGGSENVLPPQHGM